MSSILEYLGIDPDDFAWQRLANCNGMDTELFFDKYESDEQVAKIVDDVCLSCPVMKVCLKAGMDGSERGVWGGIFLVNGNPKNDKNLHKTQEVWNEIRERISE